MEFAAACKKMRYPSTDPKEKPSGKQEETSKEENKQTGDSDVNDDNEEFPDIYNEKDEDFDDPDEQEII